MLEFISVVVKHFESAIPLSTADTISVHILDLKSALGRRKDCIISVSFEFGCATPDPDMTSVSFSQLSTMFQDVSVGYLISQKLSPHRTKGVWCMIADSSRDIAGVISVIAIRIRSAHQIDRYYSN